MSNGGVLEMTVIGP